MLPLYDWAHTQAFCLPTEQLGCIRINLAGREARGIVPVERYEETCRRLEQWLRSLTSHEGKPLVSKIIRTAERPEDALKQRLPDLVVHWEDVVFDSPLRIQGSAFESYPQVTQYLSQHTSEGFCILKGSHDLGLENVLAAKDLGGIITRLVLNGSQKNNGSTRKGAADNCFDELQLVAKKSHSI